MDAGDDITNIRLHHSGSMSDMYRHSCQTTQGGVLVGEAVGQVGGQRCADRFL